MLLINIKWDGKIKHIFLGPLFECINYLTKIQI